MTKPKLQKLISTLQDLNEANVQVVRLISDLQDQYLANYDDLSNTYRGAWDEALKNRMDRSNNPTIIQKVADIRANWLNDFKFTGIAKIHFGQVRIASNFAGAGNVAQVNLGVAALAGRQIADVATDIVNGTIARDEIPVQIFLNGNVWVSINNRGFACHCIAGVRPLRVFPREASVDEANRLTDAAPNFTYADDVPGADRNAMQGRTLPSKYIPLTAGPNSFHVTRVVTTVAP
jgi:hypothetical protein